MAISKKGNFKEASGKVGKYVHYELKGQGIIRTVGQRTKPYKPREIVNQQKMAMVNQFVFNLKDFHPIGYQLAAEGTTSNTYNKAISHNYQAVSGEYPLLYFDYSKSFVAWGDMPLAKDVVVSLQANRLHVSWNPACDNKLTLPNDRVLLLVYFPGSPAFNFIDIGAKRSEGAEIMKVLRNRNTIGHVYMAFISNNRKSISNSQYLGALDFAAGQ